MKNYLKSLFKKYDLIAGVDEAGRGPLAGSVVAGVVIISQKDLAHLEDLGVKDSKKLTEKKRNKLYEILTTQFSFSWGCCDERTIDKINIFHASLLAMKKALSNVSVCPGFVIVDGKFKIPELSLPQNAIPKADELIPLVSAASIIAKVTRDKMILEAAEDYPEYGFAQNKGYGTRFHLKALKKFGPCPLHRGSFGPVKNCLN